MLIPLKDLITRHKISPTGIFHVGGSHAEERFQYRENGIARAVFVEAIPNVYEAMVDNLQEFPEYHAVNECISDTDGREVKFNITDNSGQSSSYLEFGTHKDVHPDVKVSHTITLTTKRIDTLINELQLDISDYNMLCMDLQGCELDALKGMGDEIKKIKYVYAEVNNKELYIGCALVNQIDEYLASYGFVGVETCWAGDTGWGDKFYVKQ